MNWFDIPHALLVILIVSQISVGLSNEEDVETTTSDSSTTEIISPPKLPESDDEMPEIARRFRFKRPPVSAYQPTKHKKPKNVIQDLQPLPPPLPPPQPPQYAASWPLAPPERPMPPPMQMPMPMPALMPPSRPMPRPQRPRRPRPPPYSPAPSVGDFLPSAISGLTNMLAGGGGPPPSAGQPNALGPVADLLGPLSGLVKPALGLLGPLAESLAGALPFGKTILDILGLIKHIMSFCKDFSISKLLKGLFSFIPNTIKRIGSMFSCIPRVLDKLCRLFTNLLKMIPKSLMLIPRFFHWIHKLPERIEKCIELLYRFCKSIEMLLSFIKQAFWNMLRLLGNTVLLPLKIIAKTITEVIHLPIKLLSEPVLAFIDLMRAIFYPIRKLYHFVLDRINSILEEIYYVFKLIFGSRSTVPYVAVVDPSQPPLIRVFPKLSTAPSSTLVNYVLGKR